MHKDRALPLLGALQLLDMPGATATVAGWVAEHLDASDALRVRHMASQFHLTDLAERAAEYVCGPRVVGLHFIELRVFVIGGGIVGFTLVPHLMSQL
jgi:hypothetical protein